VCSTCVCVAGGVWCVHMSVLQASCSCVCLSLGAVNELFSLYCAVL